MNVYEFYLSIEYANLVTLLLDWWLHFVVVVVVVIVAVVARFVLCAYSKLFNSKRTVVAMSLKSCTFGCPR